LIYKLTDINGDKNMNIPTSILTKYQQKEVIKESPQLIKVTLRYDDSCNNGHNTFSITGALYHRRPFIYGNVGPSGCIHEEIAEYVPELAHLIKWHLCSSDGPLHYIANTMYWIKEGNLPYARSSAIWPEATDEELLSPDIEEKLRTRLPALLADFKQSMEAAGFIY